MTSDVQKWKIKQQEYGLVIKKDYWTIDEAAMYLASYYLRDNKYKSKESADNAYIKIHKEMCDIITVSIKNENLPIKKIYYIDYDEYGDEYQATDYVNSHVKPLTLIRWAVEYDTQIPDEFIKLLPIYNKIYKTDCDNDATEGYEDIISNETILKQKELQSHQLERQVAITEEVSPLPKGDINYQYAIELGFFLNNTSGDEDGFSVKELSKHMAKVFGKKAVTDEHIGELLNALSALNKRKEASEKMRRLANERHYDLNQRKQRIRDFASSELKRNKGEYRCTCVHSQLARYVEKAANRIPPELSLESSDGKIFSLDDIKAFVKDVIDPTRIKDDGSVPDKCEIHGL